MQRQSISFAAYRGRKRSGWGFTASPFHHATLGVPLPRLYPVESARRADTVASAIRITAPVHRAEVDAAVDEFGGEILAVGEEELIDAWRSLAREEGVFCEPASAAGVAAVARGIARPGERVVCVLTGHGLKDPGAVELLDR